MRPSSFVGTLLGSLLVATALTPVGAADMTYERARNVAKEPHNWLLHHGNYEGHRFSALKEINTNNVKNLKVAFTVGLGGLEGAGGRKSVEHLAFSHRSSTARRELCDWATPAPRRAMNVSATAWICRLKSTRA